MVPWVFRDLSQALKWLVSSCVPTIMAAYVLKEQLFLKLVFFVCGSLTCLSVIKFFVGLDKIPPWMVFQSWSLQECLLHFVFTDNPSQSKSILRKKKILRWYKWARGWLVGVIGLGQVKFLFFQCISTDFKALEKKILHCSKFQWKLSYMFSTTHNCIWSNIQFPSRRV